MKEIQVPQELKDQLAELEQKAKDQGVPIYKFYPLSLVVRGRYTHIKDGEVEYTLADMDDTPSKDDG